MGELVTKADLQAGLALLQSQMDAQTLRLTVRLGGIVAIGIGVLAALLKLA